jgi:hypothetical protein
VLGSQGLAALASGRYLGSGAWRGASLCSRSDRQALLQKNFMMDRLQPLGALETIPSLFPRLGGWSGWVRAGATSRQDCRLQAACVHTVASVCTDSGPFPSYLGRRSRVWPGLVASIPVSPASSCPLYPSREEDSSQTTPATHDSLAWVATVEFFRHCPGP